MIKVAVVALLLAVGLYGWRERKLSPIVGLATPSVAAFGIAVTLQPDAANVIAHFLGVGRGADLIFYLWTLLSALLIANIHFRLRQQKSMLTTLTRELALLGAERGFVPDDR